MTKHSRQRMRQSVENGAGKRGPRRAKAEFLPLLSRAGEVASDRIDFLLMLAEAGLTEEWMQSITNQTADLIPMPAGFEHVSVRKSPVAGVGLFTNRSIGAGELIAPARRDRMRAPPGRYTNHARHPNARMVLLNQSDNTSDMDLVATRQIEAGDEVFIDYRQIGAIQGFAFDREKGLAYLRARLRRDDGYRHLESTIF
ncbi:SET domain-containing protein [Variovorax robiniae]|uniref:SET domain-containing protein n=1 Tax=Variovorax robiniae TaxID=1836199 RepID=A0ABU8X7W1_9BURK